jgi:hypothetical protein
MRNGVRQFLQRILHHLAVALALELADLRPQLSLEQKVAMAVWLLSTPQVERWRIELLTSPVKHKRGPYPQEFRQHSFT